MSSPGGDATHLLDALLRRHLRRRRCGRPLPGVDPGHGPQPVGAAPVARSPGPAPQPFSPPNRPPTRENPRSPVHHRRRPPAKQNPPAHLPNHAVKGAGVSPRAGARRSRRAAPRTTTTPPPEASSRFGLMLLLLRRFAEKAKKDEGDAAGLGVMGGFFGKSSTLDPTGVIYNFTQHRERGSRRFAQAGVFLSVFFSFLSFFHLARYLRCVMRWCRG